MTPRPLPALITRPRIDYEGTCLFDVHKFHYRLFSDLEQHFLGFSFLSGINGRGQHDARAFKVVHLSRLMGIDSWPTLQPSVLLRISN